MLLPLSANSETRALGAVVVPVAPPVAVVVPVTPPAAVVVPVAPPVAVVVPVTPPVAVVVPVAPPVAVAVPVADPPMPIPGSGRSCGGAGPFPPATASNGTWMDGSCRA